jgi:hypothetical protein
MNASLNYVTANLYAEYVHNPNGSDYGKRYEHKVNTKRRKKY